MADAILNDLARAAKRGDHHAVLTAYAKLPEDARTPDVVTARIVALVQDSKWDDVIAACNSSQHAFYRAYALYKADKLEAALEALDALPASAQADASVLHLRGQTLYRLARYGDCLPVFRSLLAATDEEDAEDIHIALLAAAVAHGSAVDTLREAPFAAYVDALTRGRALPIGWEMVYNLACALIAAGQPSLAMRALVAAYRLGDEALSSDGVDTDGVADDLSIIRCQAAYLLQVAHYDEAAAALYHNAMALTPRVTDVSVPPVLYSNLGALRGSGRDLIDVYKRLRSGAVSLPHCKLLRPQLVGVHFNRALLAAQLQRGDDARAALADMKQALDAGAVDDMAVRAELLAGALAGLKTADFEAAIAAASSTPIGAATRAQLHMAAGDASAAVAALTSVASPAAAASAAQIELSSGRPDAAVAVLSSAIAASPDAQLLFLRAALHSYRGDRTAAAADYESVLAAAGSSGHAKAAAAAALAILLVEESMIGEGARDDVIQRADGLVREATGMTVGLGGRRPSFADAGILTSDSMDKLEWAAERAATPVVAAAAATKSPSTPRAVAAAASVSAEVNEEALRAAARKAAAHRRALKQRSKRRVAHVARLTASGSFGLLGIPKPDPERWLPKRERTYGKKSRARKIAAAKMNVSSGGAQGSSSATEALTRELDVKAKTDAAKAKAAASSAAAPPPAAATPPASAGKRKGGKGRR